MNLTPALVQIVVADMAASLAFYRRLGLDLPADADTEPHVDVEIGGGVILTWDTRETVLSFNPDWTPPSGGHALGLAFKADSPADVDAAYSELTGAGATGRIEPFDAFWGQRWATVADPDGNPVDLFAPLA